MILSGQQLSAGGIVSTIVIVWLQVERLVQESKASQVLVVVKVRPQRALVVVLKIRTVTFVPSHMSMARGAEKEKGMPHSKS